MVLEQPPSKTHVSAGKTVYSWIRARNLMVSDVLTWKFYANNALWTQYSFSPSATYPSSWWYLNWTLNSTNYGNWRVDVLRNNVVIAQQHFTYNPSPNQLPELPNRTMMVPTAYDLTDSFQGNDPDGSIFRYEVLTQPIHGTVETFAGRNRKFTYRSYQGFVGRDSFRVRAVDDENVPGAAAYHVFDVVSTTAVESGADGLALQLTAISPHPVSGSAEIAYTLPRRTTVRVELFDPSGARVRMLEGGERAAGRHSVAWDARDDRGRRIPAGIYFLRLSDGRSFVSRRMVVAR